MDLSDGEFQLDSIKGFNNETIEAPDAETALELQKKDPKAYIKIADK